MARWFPIGGFLAALPPLASDRSRRFVVSRLPCPSSLTSAPRRCGAAPVRQVHEHQLGEPRRVQPVPDEEPQADGGEAGGPRRRALRAAGGGDQGQEGRGLGRGVRRVWPQEEEAPGLSAAARVAVAVAAVLDWICVGSG